MDVDSVEEWKSHIDEINHCYERLMNIAMGIETEAAYDKRFNYDVELDNEINLFEFWITVQFIQEQLSESNNFVLKMMTGRFLKSIIDGLPEEELEKMAVENHEMYIIGDDSDKPDDDRGEISFQ